MQVIAFKEFRKVVNQFLEKVEEVVGSGTGVDIKLSSHTINNQ